MNAKKRILCLMGLLLLSCQTVWAQAQDQYHIAFKGTRATTDNSGKIVSAYIDNATLVQEFAKVNGIHDTSWLGMAYHFGGNALGDTIEIVNRTNGTPVYSVFGLYFGEDFGRPFLVSASRRQSQRLEYIYTDQNSQSLGSALLTTYYFLDSNGKTNNRVVLGSVQYVVAPTTLHTNTQACSGTFTTGDRWVFH
jgi:hypothetical protein